MLQLTNSQLKSVRKNFKSGKGNNKSSPGGDRGVFPSIVGKPKITLNSTQHKRLLNSMHKSGIKVSDRPVRMGNLLVSKSKSVLFVTNGTLQTRGSGSAMRGFGFISYQKDH